MDLINRQDAIDAIIADKIEDRLPVITDTQERDFEVFNSSCDRHAKILKELPSVQKIGKWIEHEDWYDTYYECSSCGEAFSLIEGAPKDNGYNYCPNCGAKMMEVEE